MTGQQLKNSILQMAVQGKLVPQDPNDEPASVLLERIRKEKEQLIKEGEIKKEKNPSYIFRGADNLPYEKVGKNEPVCIADEVPFEIPDSWEWVRHNELFEVSGGSQPPKSKFISEPKKGYVRLYQIRDYGKNPVPIYIPLETANKTTSKGDILLARYGASLGKVFVAEDGAYNVAMAKVIPLFSNEWILRDYMFLYYQSDLYQAVIHGNSRSAQAGFNKDDLSAMWLPIPPLAEQRRIIEQYKILNPLVEKYSYVEKEIECLNIYFPDQLKKSILQEAVQGKLVPQDPNDEPASVLLERIREEKQRLIKEGKIKKDKHESIIFRRDNSYYEKLDGVERCIDNELPFKIPESWGWTKIESISMPVGSKANQVLVKEILDHGRIPVVSQGKELIDGYCNDESKKISTLPLVMFGDHTRNVKYIDFEFVIGADGTKFHKVIICSAMYIYYWMLYASETLRNRGYARHYSLLKKCYIPLPPLNEQIRIVKKLKEISSYIE